MFRKIELQGQELHFCFEDCHIRIFLKQRILPGQKTLSTQIKQFIHNIQNINTTKPNGYKDGFLKIIRNVPISDIRTDLEMVLHPRQVSLSVQQVR